MIESDDLVLAVGNNSHRQRGLDTEADVDRAGRGLASLDAIEQVLPQFARVAAPLPLEGDFFLALGKRDDANARGDAALLEKLYKPTDQVGDDTDLMFAALRGDRDVANHLAAKIDSRPFGPMKLAQFVYTCLCGAPFDIEATPKFATSLEDAGLLWPPPDTITFPLKGW